MNKSFVVFSPLPIDHIRIDWIPVCPESRYIRCHDEKNGSKFCSYSATSPKSQCRKIRIEITEAGPEVISL